jgi:PII-like signaling protein
MSDSAIKLTIYFAERDRAAGRFLADALFDLYESRGFRTSILLHGSEGFGIRNILQTERLLTLSEDLPLVSIAVDTRDAVEAALPEVSAIMGHGLITLERARMFTADIGSIELPDEQGAAFKLTLYGGRAERVGRRPSYLAAVDAFRRHGAAGTSVIPGIDGTLHGVRRRPRFFSTSVNVPLSLLAVGSATSIAATLPELGSVFSQPVVTLERVQVLKVDGRHLAELPSIPEHDESGLPIWQKLMVHCEALAKVDGHPLYVELVRRLREAGGAGATVLRGIWGYYGDRPLFGDRFMALRRNVPVHTVIVDTAPNIRRLWPIVDEVTAETGLITCELVPALRATGPDVRRGTLRLASP